MALAINTRKFAHYYFAGSVGGALALLGFWGLSEAFNQFAFFVRPDLQDFYAPMVLSGLCGLLFFIPVNLGWALRGVVFSLFPAFIYLAHEHGWLYGSSFSFAELATQQSLIWFGLFAVCWGIVAGWLLQGE